MTKKSQYKLIVNKQEANFVLFCRKVGYGELTVIINDGKPHLAKKGFENIRFDYMDEFDLDNTLELV